LTGIFQKKLGQAINSAKEASGQVQNKDHWISNAKQYWSVFESGIKEELES